MNKLIVGMNSSHVSSNGIIGFPPEMSFLSKSAYAGSNFEQLEIAEGITEIGVRAFADCQNLTKVVLPATVTRIDDSAFCNCIRLKEIVFSDGLSLISWNAFEGCVSLNSLVFPPSLRKLNGSAFMGCRGLQSVVFQGAGAAVGKNAFHNCTALSSVTFPEGEFTLGDYVFQGCQSLRKVSFQTLPAYTPNTFQGLPNLEPVVVDNQLIAMGLNSNAQIPAEVTRIGDYACYCNTQLTQMTIPVGVRSIGQGAFARCARLSAVQLPPELEVIGDSGFECCFDLANLELPSGLKAIGAHAFSHCERLKAIVIPSEVEEVSDEAFSYTGLDNVLMPKKLKKTAGIFKKCKFRIEKKDAEAIKYHQG